MPQRPGQRHRPNPGLRACSGRRVTSRIAPCWRGSPRRRRTPPPAPDGAQAPRPAAEEDTHDQAHADADGNVLDPHQADAPSGRLDDVEQDHQNERERRLPPGERDDRRGDPGEKDRGRQRDPRGRGVRADPREQGRAEAMKPATVPSMARTASCRYSAHSSAAPTARRGEDHPERVLDPGQSRGEHRQPQPGATTQAVV